MKPLLAALALAALALPAQAALRPCNTALVNGGLCAQTTDVLLSYSIPAADQPDFEAAWAAELNYQSSIPCRSQRVVDRGILVVAGPGDGTCAAPLFGQSVPNPQTAAAAVDRYIRGLLAEPVRRYRIEQRVEAERAAAEAEESEPGL